MKGKTYSTQKRSKQQPLSHKDREHRLIQRALHRQIELYRSPSDQTPELTPEEPYVEENRPVTKPNRAMETVPLVTVVIPVFNKEADLASCLHSLLNSSHSNLEVICIDDCSTDGSREIISEFGLIDTRVRQYFQDGNRGASVARNIGIGLATGKYIMFLDGDDMLAPDAVNSLVERAKLTDADIVRGKITGLRQDGSRHKLAAEDLLHHNDAERVAWAKEESLWFYWYFTANLYRRKFLLDQHIMFPAGIRNEDPQFLCRCFMSTTKISLLNQIVYYYRIGSEQVRKTPSQSFLRGFALGNYSISQYIQNHNLAMQYFLIQLPSVRQHAHNMVKHLPVQSAQKLIHYLALMYKKLDVEMVEFPERQPWERKRTLSSVDVRFAELVKTSTAPQIYNTLREEL